MASPFRRERYLVSGTCHLRIVRRGAKLPCRSDSEVVHHLSSSQKKEISCVIFTAPCDKKRQNFHGEVILKLYTITASSPRRESAYNKKGKEIRMWFSFLHIMKGRNYHGEVILRLCTIPGPSPMRKSDWFRMWFPYLRIIKRDGITMAKWFWGCANVRRVWRIHSPVPRILPDRPGLTWSLRFLFRQLEAVLFFHNFKSSDHWCWSARILSAFQSSPQVSHCGRCTALHAFACSRYSRIRYFTPHIRCRSVRVATSTFIPISKS